LPLRGAAERTRSPNFPRAKPAQRKIHHKAESAPPCEHLPFPSRLIVPVGISYSPLLAWAKAKTPFPSMHELGIVDNTHRVSTGP
jgi:hypothetical protein